MRRRVLFVSHSAGRSGAPLVLLSLMSWLVRNGDVEAATVLMDDGELIEDFRRLGPVVTLNGDADHSSLLPRLLSRIGGPEPFVGELANHLSGAEWAIRRAARRAARQGMRSRINGLFEPDLIYLNTVNTAAVVPLLPSGPPVVTHVHELEYNFRALQRTHPDSLTNAVRRSTRYVAASRAVAEDLVRVLNVRGTDVDIHHDFIAESARPRSRMGRCALREALGLPQDALIVGSTGTVEWRKGADLFVHLAKRMLERYGHDMSLSFVWVGPFATWGDWWEGHIQHDIEHADLEAQVRFTGPRSDPGSIMELFDVFVLTSRSDAFPLVCLEAGALGKPVVSFACGGAREFLKEEDLVVPYLSIDAMAAKVYELLRDRTQRESVGARLAARVDAEYHVDMVAPAILETINRTINVGNHPRNIG